MRRGDREITEPDKIEDILAGGRYLHLGLFDDEYPYVVPLHYGYEKRDGVRTFYVHCAGEGHKLDCLRENGNVFVEIDRGEQLVAADIPCGYGALYESVMCRGKASIVESLPEKCRALEILMKTQTGEEHRISKAMAEKVTVIRIEALTCTAKARAR